MSRVTIGNNGITKKYNVLTHKGVDIGWSNTEENNQIIAHSNGVVTWTQTGQKHNTKATGNKSYGNCVKIKHTNGYYTLYAHLKSVKVKKGQNVKQGQVIGIMGETGKAYGRHLHFEVRKPSDIRINPTKYIYTDLPNMSKKVTYQVYDNIKNKWLPLVESGSNDYAGNLGHAISGLKISKIKYRAHDKVKNKWLPYVTGNKSYAGNLPNNINGLDIPLPYEVHTIGGRWEKVNGTEILKESSIDGIRIL